MRKLPEPNALGTLLTGLLGKGVKVKAVPKHPLPAGQPVVLARYATEDGQLVACVCDLRFAAMAGAALTMVPPGMAKEGIAAGKLSETLQENFAEVLNIMAQLITSSGATRVVLQKTEYLKTPLPADVIALLAGTRADFDVIIDAYGAGNVTLAG